MKGKILKASDLQQIRVSDNGEKLVILTNCELLCDYRRSQTGLQNIILRESVIIKLVSVQKRLQQQFANIQLLLVEGYRSPEYQERYYLDELLKRQYDFSDLTLEQIMERVHQFVALPSVAGHPTGGAIDLTLMIDGAEVSMGEEIADFSCPEILPTYSPLANSEQAYWRSVLHDAMISEGFAPFYGEWWHFSFGDREWAAFYGHSEAIYGPVYDYTSI